MTEENIQSTLQENRLFAPSAEFSQQACIKSREELDALRAKAEADDMRFSDNLPKTRSGKIMRRLLRTIAAGEEITQDISTLENESIVLQLHGKT